MPRKQPGENTAKDVALDKYHIHRVLSLEEAESCPESLRKIFKLVSESENIRKAHYGARLELADCRGVFDTKAAHDYRMRLRKRADKLADICLDPDMEDSPEETWVRKLLPLVFLPFDRKEEEKLDEIRPFHHWYATLPLLWTKLTTPKFCLPAELSPRKPTSHQ